MTYFDESYWTQRYNLGATGWDIGYPSTPLVQYLDQIEDREIQILIPGGGNGHEAAYAFKKGFFNVHLLDFSEIPLTNFSKSYPDFPKDHIHHENFFEHLGSYDLILEQTFFCALHPDEREAYCQKMKELLKPGGFLAGVLFSTEFLKSGPPFGGNEEVYRTLFLKFFSIQKLEHCYNSIPPRAGNELFFELQNQ
ncbi:MAG: methyltransferase domain-containing protein [Algoriphagus sp.]|uniref:methyltransferase n=1 Tax=Algoriphagus sp. TaxID=1872435 RepID=UPI001827EEB7|nr:methyltransferase [Algoriphagus sp.]NVJ84775.1 methyltransferase domain-containing protein [Algoriphagus sp.]